MSAPDLCPLCVADDATFWPWKTWADFARMSDDERRATLVMVPVVGLTDWGLGHPLDMEEILVTNLLKAAMGIRPANVHPLVLPPLRFVLGQAGRSAFAVDVPTAHALLREVALSIQDSGFRRLVLVNASPWNEELCAAASRDLRIELGLQIFRMNLSALGLDLHPKRSRSRREVQTLATALIGAAPHPETDAIPEAAAFWGDETITPLTTKPASLEEAREEGGRIFEETAAQMAALLGKIAEFPALAHDGKILPMTAP